MNKIINQINEKYSDPIYKGCRSQVGVSNDTAVDPIVICVSHFMHDGSVNCSYHELDQSSDQIYDAVVEIDKLLSPTLISYDSWTMSNFGAELANRGVLTSAASQDMANLTKQNEKLANLVESNTISPTELPAKYRSVTLMTLV